jgi:hypothetical protein
MKSSDSLSGIRQRPDLRCITDKNHLRHPSEDLSPVKLRHQSHHYQICDIPDQGGGNQRLGGFSSYVTQFVTIPSGYDQRYESKERENPKKLTLKHSRSKSNVKPVKSDLKKGSFSDKQSIPKKGSQNKILIKKNEYRALSPFQLKVANSKPALPCKILNKAKENKEELMPQWRKYMRELGLRFRESKQKV